MWVYPVNKRSFLQVLLVTRLGHVGLFTGYRSF